MAGKIQHVGEHERPFVHIHPQEMDGVFRDEAEVARLLALVEDVNQVQWV